MATTALAVVAERLQRDQQWSEVQRSDRPDDQGHHGRRWHNTGDQWGVSIVRRPAFAATCSDSRKTVAGSNTATAPALFQDDYSHDLSLNSYSGSGPNPSNCAHDNGWFIDSAQYVTIKHSYSILTGAGYCVTGAITALADYGLPHDITVDSSYMEGITGADLYTGSPNACGKPNIAITNNALSNDNGYSGTKTVLQWTPTGNTWSETMCRRRALRSTIRR